MPPASGFQSPTAVTLSADDIVLNVIRDRVIDGLVFENLFNQESATWMVFHLVTPDVVQEIMRGMRFPKYSGHLLDWLEANADGVKEVSRMLVKKFLTFSSTDAKPNG